MDELQKALAKFKSLLADFKTMKDESDKKDKEINDLKAEMTSFVVGNKSTSDESRALQYFGGSLKSLLQENTEDPKYAAVPATIKHAARTLKEDIIATRVFEQKFGGAARDSEDSPAIVKSILDSNYGKSVLAPRVKSFGSSTAGAGLEFIATAQPSTYVEEYQDHNLGLFARLNQHPMYTNKQKILTAGKSIARASWEKDTPPDSHLHTGDRELEAKKFVERYDFPEEFKEDNAIDIIKLGIREVNLSHIRAYDIALISGCAMPISDHIDADVVELNNNRDVRHHWDGLRKKALANSVGGSTVDFNNSAVSFELANLMYSRISKGRHIWVCSQSTYHQMIALKEVRTIDVAGAGATTQTGALYTLFGFPIFESEFMRDDLNITGTYGPTAEETASSTEFVKNRSSLLLFNPERNFAGNRRPIKIYLTRNQDNDTDELRGWSRKAYQSLVQDSRNRDIILGINVKR